MNILAARSSNHKPLADNFVEKVERRSHAKRGFKFQASWQLVEECNEVIKKAWERNDQLLSGMRSV